MPNNPTEQNVQESIESTGGIPEIEVEMEVSGMTQTAVDKTLSIADMAADAKATGDAINNVSGSVTDLAADVAGILAWTGDDIPLNEETGAPSIAEAIESIFANLYPVGTLYITAAETLPSMISDIGTWVEVAIPLKLNDIKHGSRNYAVAGEEFTPGNLHCWMRTE